jgi:GNAT superfamily N-acetyltransferase
MSTATTTHDASYHAGRSIAGIRRYAPATRRLFAAADLGPGMPNRRGATSIDCWIDLWRPEEADEIFRNLEAPNWCPWLRTPSEILSRYPLVFPEGQLLVRTGSDEIRATLTMNRIQWNGDPDALPTWDEVAGANVRDGDYSATFVPDGNTMVLMSMNVHPLHQGDGHPRRLMHAARVQAEKLGATHLIGPFRPNQFGKWKLERPGQRSDGDFAAYCAMTIERDGLRLPGDGWLRNLVRNGMVPIKVQDDAMVVSIARAEFEAFRHGRGWVETRAGEWQCGEAGTWFVNEHTAVYREKNLWGRLSIG